MHRVVGQVSKHKKVSSGIIESIFSQSGFGFGQETSETGGLSA
jgi:hypothetical protein